ncbi:MAG: hypothetical protein AAF411_04090 [Myxococcota bacterium]
MPRFHLTSRAAGPIILMLFGACSAPPIEVELATLTPEALVLRVTSEPGAVVSFDREGEYRQVVGADGRAELRMPYALVSENLWEDGSGPVYAFLDLPFGPYRMRGHGRATLPVRRSFLENVTVPNGTGFLRVIAAYDSEQCLFAESLDESSATIGSGSLGTGYFFWAPPQSEVTFGPLEFAIPDTALYATDVDPFSILSSLPVGESSTRWTVRVNPMDQPPVSGDVSVTLTDACRARVAESIASHLDEGWRWPSEGDRQPFALSIDRTRELRVHGEPDANATLTDASVIAVEEVVSSPRDADTCRIVRRATQVTFWSDGNITDDGSSITHRPIRHRTRVSIFSPTSDEPIATREFQPSTRTCAENVYPDSEAVERWTSARLARLVARSRRRAGRRR